VTSERRDHATLLPELREIGCPACRRGEFADERFVFGFVYEHHNDGRTLDALRASLGFCDVHTRRLLSHQDAPHVMSLVYAEVVAAAVARLRAGHPADGGTQPCPMCLSGDTSRRAFIRALAGAVGDPDVGNAYRGSDGLCLPHLREALADASHETAAALLRDLATRLRTPDEPPALIERLAGRDTDRGARRLARIRLREAFRNPAGRPTLESLRARLAVEACPTCAAGALAEARHLAWMGRESRSHPSNLVVEGSWLCPRHLHDLVEKDGETARWVAARLRADIEWDLARSEDRLERVPARTLRGRWRQIRERAAHEPGDEPRKGGRAAEAVSWLARRRGPALRSALAPLLQERACATCRVVATAEARETDLIMAGLLDRPIAARYARSHGLCLRHVLALPDDRPAAVTRRVLRARLAILAWELEEAGRKSSWSVRFEARGDEVTAWRRAPAQLDGRNYLGAPAASFIKASRTAGTGAP
jgi:hypothetical protein